MKSLSYVLFIAFILSVFNSWDFSSGLKIDPNVKVKDLSPGDNFTVVCYSDDGNPVTWNFVKYYKNTVVVTPGVNSTLQITNATVYNTAPYTCSSQDGKSSVKIFIGVYYCKQINNFGR